jgi:hypothetical protein
MKLTMRMQLGHPVLILLNSFALLFFGAAIGIHYRNSLWGASKVALLGAALMILHDWISAAVIFWIAAQWVRKSTHHL